MTAGSSNPAPGRWRHGWRRPVGHLLAAETGAFAPNGGDLEAMTERLAKRLRKRHRRPRWLGVAGAKLCRTWRDADAVAAYERTGTC